MGIHNHDCSCSATARAEWSKSGQHTGSTNRADRKRRIQPSWPGGRALAELKLDDPLVVSSPRQRALVTGKFAA